jgi:hypothetical protein
MHRYCNETTKSNQFTTDRKRGVEKYRDLGNEKGPVGLLQSPDLPQTWRSSPGFVGERSDGD